MTTEDGNVHHMTLIRDHEGVEEWYCPICGRRMLMDYGSKFKKVILEAGDEYAIHSGGKGGLQMGHVQAVPVDGSFTQKELQTDDAHLAPWVTWLEEMGFEDLWNNNVQ
jgi:hypothetical protein